MSIHTEVERYGYRTEPSPRANPDGSLYGQWRLVSPTGRTVLRAPSRDQLEEKMYGWYQRAHPTVLDA